MNRVFRILSYVLGGAAIVIGSFIGTLWLITPAYEAALHIAGTDS